MSCVQGSFIDFDWSDGDVVFANSTCFDDELMSAMAKQAELLRPGSMFVTFTKALPSGCFEIIEKKRYRMSWGPATVFIQRRLADDGTALPSYRLNILPSDNIEYDDREQESSGSSSKPENSRITKPVGKSATITSKKPPLPTLSSSSNRKATTTATTTSKCFKDIIIIVILVTFFIYISLFFSFLY